MSGLYGKGDKGKADRLFSLIIRARGACEACGDSYYPNLQCAHVVTRRRNATRTDETAAFCLCKSCHAKFTHDPLGWVRWVESKIGADALNEIDRRSKAGIKVNTSYWRDEVARLKAIAEQLGVAA